MSVKASRREELARIAYEAYGMRVGWKNYLGEPMPLYDDLGEQIQLAWQDAVQAVRDAPSDDRDN